MEKIKKGLAFLLAATVLIAALPIAALAEYTLPEIESIVVEDVSLIENTGGFETTDYNPETGEYESYYWYFIGNNLRFKIEFKNGDIINDSGSGFWYNGEWFGFDVNDDQGLQNQWGLGEHKATVSVMGVSTEITVTIIETPVEKIEIKDVSIIEKSSGNETTDYNYETEEYETYYRYYLNDKLNYTITLKNGDILNGSGGSFWYNGEWFGFDVNGDQGPQNEWGIGEHKATVSVMGVSTEITVTIEEIPIEKIEIKDVHLIENADGYKDTGYNSETGEYESYYRYYYNNKLSYTITLKNGDIINGSGGSFEYNGNWYYFSIYDDQRPQNEWGIGEHKATVSVMGVSTEFTVTIEESPYKAIEIMSVEPIYENRQCYFDNGKPYYYASELNIVFKVYDKNGNSFIATNRGNNHINVDSNQEEEPWTVGGENKFTLSYMGLSAEGTVELLPSEPFEYIEQNGGIYITDYKGGNVETLEIPSEIDGKPVKGLLSFCSWSYFNELIIPDSVETIGEDAFENISVESIVIGSGVKQLDQNMVYCLRGLSNITVSEDNPYYCDIDGIVYDKEAKTLVIYPCGKGNEYHVPDTVNNIDVLGNLNGEIDINVVFSENSTAYVTENGVTYNADKTTILKCNKEKAGSYTMPNTVTTIAPKAFSGCEKLTAIKISNKVTDIVYATFIDCPALKTIELPSNLKTIDKYSFANTGIESITIPESVTSIDQGAFGYCENLKNITLPNRLKTIEEDVFKCCAKLESINIPDNVAEIKQDAFFSCENLKNITFPKNLKSIGRYAFMGCENLTKAVFKNKDTLINDSAFSGCGLKDIEFPSGIKTIGGSYAFSSTNIEKLVIPEDVTDIVYGSFYDCSALKEIDIPSSLKHVGGRAFENTAWFNAQNDGPVYLEHVLCTVKGTTDIESIEVKPGTTVIGGYALSGLPKLTDVSLPEGLEAIGEYAFNNSNSLKEINIPSSVSDIVYQSFARCSSLESINVDKGSKYYKSVDGVLFNKSGSELIWCPKRDTDVYEVPASVTKIGTDAFCDSGVSTIRITNPSTVIESGALGNYEGQMVIICPKDSKAKDYAIERNIPFIEIENVKLESENKSVSISGDQYTISDQAEVKVQNKQTSDLSINDSAANRYNLKKSEAYDISLEYKGLAIQPKDKVTVSIDVPASLDGTKCRVLRIDENGKITDMRAAYNNGKMSFKTDHFSDYVITESEKVFGDLNKDTKIDTDDVTTLLFSSFFPEEYPIEENCDFNVDGKVDIDDVLHLLKHVYFPKYYAI